MALFRRKKNENMEKWNVRTMFGPNMSFSVTEAYKLLRANIMFSFSDEGRGHVVGITSSLQSEGKSSTALNTAYALAEAGARVVLVDADLRRPSVASKLNLARTPGLTNTLVSRVGWQELLQYNPMAPNMAVLTSGDIPPNPSELLGSARMEQLIRELTQQYDYVIVDLPPVTTVPDAAILSKYLDGYLLVVRQKQTRHRDVVQMLKQLNLAESKLLGFTTIGGESGKKYYGYRRKNR
jgi:capsular exopolysaccharide synthesis family protein